MVGEIKLHQPHLSSDQQRSCSTRGFIILNYATQLHRDYILGRPPAQAASHHQDFLILLVGDSELKLHLPLESLEGGQPKLYTISC